tara:strand:- start:11132 stop:11710 length:579 start_codon:yes stop_codon:yes gene_type:complete
MSQNIYTPQRLVVYVVASDDGLAPNVQGDVCTLSVCKPVVRRVAKQGADWVVGMSTTKDGINKLIYVMQVEEKIPYNDFYNDGRFACKKPDMYNFEGDNFILDGNAMPWGMHYGFEDKMKRNMKSPYALIATKFWYFGKNAPEIPSDFRDSKLILGPRRGHKIVDDKSQVSMFYNWLCQSYKCGIHGKYRDS